MKKIIIALLIVMLAGLLPSCGAAGQGMQVLPALKEAGLAGRLIFILYQQKGNQVMQLDLATGATRSLFAAPDKSWLASAEVSPDGSTILLAYAPPPPAGQVQLANTDLYRMPADGASAPQALLERSRPNESYTHPIWAPDGQTIYYTHSAPTTTSRLGVEFEHRAAQTGRAGGDRPAQCHLAAPITGRCPAGLPGAV